MDQGKNLSRKPVPGKDWNLESLNDKTEGTATATFKPRYSHTVSTNTLKTAKLYLFSFNMENIPDLPIKIYI
jgi:hypothetical protein